MSAPDLNRRHRPADPVAQRLARELARHVVEASGDELRKAALVEWGPRVLPAYFRLPPSGMHRWLGAQLDGLADQRGARLNVLGPRGGAKSTLVTLGYVLRAAVDEREPYIWIVSDTIGQARTHLAHVRAELESNPLLAAYYPQAVRRGGRWRTSALELASGVCLEAFGAGQRLRGRRRRQHRPTLIVCDDLENDEHVASALQRQANWLWFQGALLNAGDSRTNVVNLATALHRDALALQLHRSSGWTSRIFAAIERWPQRMDLWDQWQERYARAEGPAPLGAARQFYDERRTEMDAGAELLWPEHEDLYALMRLRADLGRPAFDREKQSSPIDPDRCEWPEEYFGHHIWFDEWPAVLTVRVVALDPSKGADARLGDYSAYVLLGQDPHGLWYVEADLARRPTPAMVETGVAICRRFQAEALGVEANQFQELLVAEFRDAFSRLHRRQVQIRPIHNYANKALRIRRLGPLLAQRRLRFRARSESTRLLVEQLRDFPLAAHDDGPDALEMALRLADAKLAPAALNDGLGDCLIADP